MYFLLVICLLWLGFVSPKHIEHTVTHNIQNMFSELMGFFGGVDFLHLVMAMSVMKNFQNRMKTKS